MHLEKADRLFREFPDLFQREQLVHGFECQDGWFDLIYGLAEQIREDRIQFSEQKYFEVVQVKQKMGKLRINIRGGDDFIQKLLKKTEQESQSICELDGKPATGLFVCAPHWYRYLCETCGGLHGCMTFEDYFPEKTREVPIDERIQQSE
jgi:hypothetical protein